MWSTSIAALLLFVFPLMFYRTLYWLSWKLIGGYIQKVADGVAYRYRVSLGLQVGEKRKGFLN